MKADAMKKARQSRLEAPFDFWFHMEAKSIRRKIPIEMVFLDFVLQLMADLFREFKRVRRSCWSVEDLAGYWRIQPSTIQKLVDSGKLRTRKRLGEVAFDGNEIQSFIRSGRPDWPNWGRPSTPTGRRGGYEQG